jgi:hypothetical protein
MPTVRLLSPLDAKSTRVLISNDSTRLFEEYKKTNSVNNCSRAQGAFSYIRELPIPETGFHAGT